jgi:hypothetical protein
LTGSELNSLAHSICSRLGVITAPTEKMICFSVEADETISKTVALWLRDCPPELLAERRRAVRMMSVDLIKVSQALTEGVYRS